jgi:hypothetical protein
MLAGTTKGQRTAPFSRRLWSRVAATIIILAGLCAASLGALAQAPATQTSFIDPFPSGDVYRLHVVGDTYAEGLHGALSQALAKNPYVQIIKRIIEVRTLRQADWDEEVKKIEDVAKATPIDIAVVMFGASDFGSVGMPGRRWLRFGSEAWKAQYATRVDRTMKALKGRSGAVYWLGLPVVGRSDRNEAYQTISEIMRERAYINGVKYIDVYTGFTDENGSYSSYGPDVDGKSRLLRSRDGNYFTAAGYRKLSYFVEREIRRDLNRARAERNVPLAGSPLEQRRISPPPSTSAKPAKRTTVGLAPTAQPGTAKPSAKRPKAVLSPLRKLRPIRELKADNGTVVVSSLQGERRLKTLKLTIVRPPISATVVELVTRKQSADRPARMGDSVTLQLPGGATLLSSVTPANPTLTGDGRKVSPTQSPFFKVWSAGERLTPRKGRADDFSWPPDEPIPVVRAGAKSRPFPRRRFLEPEADDGMPPVPEPNPLGRAAGRLRR